MHRGESKVSSNINDYNISKISWKTKWNFHDIYVHWWRKRIHNNAKKGTFPVTKYPVHNRRRPNVVDGPLYLSWIKGCPLVVGLASVEANRVSLLESQWGKKERKREKNYNEYFNKPRPIYFERDYAWRFVVCFGPPFF